MSARMTFLSGETDAKGFHLFTDLLENQVVLDMWLSVTGVEFEASAGRVAVKLPRALYEAIRRMPRDAGDVDFAICDATDDDLRADAETWITATEARAAAGGPFASIDLFHLEQMGETHEERVAAAFANRVVRREKYRELRASVASILEVPEHEVQ